MFDSVSRFLGFGGVGLASRKEAELWDENRRLRVENAELMARLEQFKSANSKVSETLIGREEYIAELEAEVERLRGGVPDFRAQSKIAIAGQLANSAEVSRVINNMDQLTSIRIEENHGD